MTMFGSNLRWSAPFLAAAVLAGSALPGLARGELSTSDKAALQATMFGLIDRRSIDGAYLHVNLDNGDVQRLYPAKAHPMILMMGEHFVLYTDFRDKDGKPVNVDFYVAKKEKAYVVFRTVVGNRAPLKKLMALGKVTSVR